MQDHLQKLTSAHAALSLEVKALADRLVDALALVEGMGHQINLLSTLAEAPPDEPPPIAEMAVHAPSEIPPVRYCATDCVLVDNHEGPCIDGGGSDIATPSIGLPAYAAEFAPDCESQTPIDASLLHEGNTSEPQPGISMFGELVVDLEKPLPCIGGRKKTEYTAKEWAMSTHFLNYMKKAPFKDWSASEQVDKRDAFVAAMPADLKMNRWGERFSKLCGVA